MGFGDASQLWGTSGAWERVSLIAGEHKSLSRQGFADLEFSPFLVQSGRGLLGVLRRQPRHG